MQCIERYYQPAFQRADITQKPVRLKFFSETASSPCGSDQGAFYCLTDATIYIPAQYYADTSVMRLNATRMLFHEYSHHLQQQIGVMSESAALNREESMQVTRRIELQASCWGELAMRDSSTLGWNQQDERDFQAFNSSDAQFSHGVAASRMMWYERARKGTTLAACNTWRASAEQVA